MNNDKQNLFSANTQNRKPIDSPNSHSSFGVGFILGATFAILAIFFLSTRKGKIIAKKIISGDFGWEDLNQLLTEDAGQNFDLGNTKEDDNHLNIHQQENGGVDFKNLRTPVLGRRFFRRRN